MLLCGSFFLLPLHTLFLLFFSSFSSSFSSSLFCFFFPLSSFSSSFSFLYLLLSSLFFLFLLNYRKEQILFSFIPKNTLLTLSLDWDNLFSTTSVNIFQIVFHQHYLCQNYLLLTKYSCTSYISQLPFRQVAIWLLMAYELSRECCASCYARTSKSK